MNNVIKKELIPLIIGVTYADCIHLFDEGKLFKADSPESASFSSLRSSILHLSDIDEATAKTAVSIYNAIKTALNN